MRYLEVRINSKTACHKIKIIIQYVELWYQIINILDKVELLNDE